MKKEDLAKLLDGREIGSELSGAEEKQAKAAGLVVVFGASDDLMEFRGAINDEQGGGDEIDALVDAHGLLPERSQIDSDDDDKLEDYFSRKKTAAKITGSFDTGGWTFKTAIPHAKFKIMEDGEVYGGGLVFSMADLGNWVKNTPPKKAKSKKNRPSPSDSATLYEEGFEMKGNDGNMYVIAVASNQVKRWVKKKK